MRLLWITVGTFRHSIYLLSRSKTKQQNYWNACYWMQKYFSQCINAEITNSCSHYFVNNCAFLFKATHIAKFPCKRERIKSFCFMFGRTFKQHERWNMVVFNRFVFSSQASIRFKLIISVSEGHQSWLRNFHLRSTQLVVLDQKNFGNIMLHGNFLDCCVLFDLTNISITSLFFSFSRKLWKRANVMFLFLVLLIYELCLQGI